jgi:hypothetical protein
MDDSLGSERRRVRLVAASTVALTFLAFAPTLGNGFVTTWDDGVYVVHNAKIQGLSLATVRWAFTSFHAHFWAPLTWLSLALDHAIWGLDPLGYHLTNALCHAAAAGLVFAVALELLAAPACGISPGMPRVAAALLAALLWSLHPLRVESVAWVTERKDVLSALFGIAAFLAYVRHARGAARPFWRSRAYAAALGLGALSLAAKPALATFPVVLLLVDWVPLGRFAREGARALLLEKLPWVALGMVATALTAVGFAGSYMPLTEASVVSAVLIALRGTWAYLWLTVWPSALSPFHLHPGQVSVLDPAYLAPAAAVVALTVAAVAVARRRPVLAAAFLAFLALLAPGLSSARVGVTAMADRFTYLPAIPLSLLSAAGLVRAVAGRSARVRVAASAAAIAVLAVLALVTVRQIGVWHDDVSLWTRAIDLQPRFSGRMYSERAQAHAMRGDLRSALADMDEAVNIASAKRYGMMQDLYARRARLRAGLGDAEGAASDFGTAIEAAPVSARSWFARERDETLRALGRADLAGEDPGGHR